MSRPTSIRSPLVAHETSSASKDFPMSIEDTRGKREEDAFDVLSQGSLSSVAQQNVVRTQLKDQSLFFQYHQQENVFLRRSNAATQKTHPYRFLPPVNTMEQPRLDEAQLSFKSFRGYDQWLEDNRKRLSYVRESVAHLGAKSYDSRGPSGGML